MIDLHTHVLPGLDDGPADLDGALALARAAARSGIARACATPHIDHTYGLGAADVQEALASLRGALRRTGIQLDVLPGGELAPDRAAELDLGELERLRLGRGPFVLLECPIAGPFPLENVVRRLQLGGLRVLLAHPERSPMLQREPDRLRELVRSGALCSVTASSFSGRFGRTARGYALALLEGGLVHDVSSDAHDAELRPPDLASGIAAAEAASPGAGELADWLTREAPAAILAGAELPPRPSLPQRARGLLGRLRR